jgi:hypothetical protein
MNAPYFILFGEMDQIMNPFYVYLPDGDCSKGLGSHLTKRVASAWITWPQKEAQNIDFVSYFQDSRP